MKLRPGEGVWLDRLKVSNFRSIASLDLEFRHRLTVLIGANGAGKTTVLDAISCVLGGTQPEGRVLVESDGRRVGQRRAGETTIELSAGQQKAWMATGSERGPTGVTLASLVSHADNRSGVRAYFDADRFSGSSFSDIDLRNDFPVSPFGELLQWFRAKSAEEARKTQELVDRAVVRSRTIAEPSEVKISDLRHRDPELESVRAVVSKMIRGTSNLRIDAETNQLVTDQTIGRRTETFEVGELAGGFRSMLVLVADLARRMVTEREMERPDARAVVLIDEVDLHLHPKWQLDVMSNLLDAFPTAQFVVTTHSEEIIASVPSECVVSLQSGDDGITARTIPAVQGATFDRVLEDAMGVPSRRPPEVQAWLDEYWKLIEEGAGEGPEATVLRTRLDELFRGLEPDLIRADLAIRRKRAVRATGS